MTYAQALVEHVAANWTTAPVLWEIPVSPPVPSVIPQIVTAGEQPSIFCEEQGAAGSLLVQWNANGASAQSSYNLAEDLRTYLVTLLGDVFPGYSIYHNLTEGVQTFDASIGTWYALVESTTWWRATP